MLLYDFRMKSVARAVLASLALLQSAGAAPEPRAPVSQRPGPTSPTPAVVGLPGYRRFHANDTFIGKPVPCTDEEKICFKYNRLYNPASGHCLPLSDPCDFVGDREQFLNGSRRLFAKCLGYQDPCPGYRMAFDGRCYRKDTVRDVICGCNAEPTPYFLGGVECRCSPATTVRVKQPSEAGRCRIPDLRFPDYRRSVYDKEPLNNRLVFVYGESSLHIRPRRFTCSSKLRECFEQRKVWVSKNKGCFVLGERGPCSDGYLVTLTKSTVASAPARCKQQNGGCPRKQIRMAFDGKCHDEREMRVAATWSRTLARNIVGEYEVRSVEIYPVVIEGDCAFQIPDVRSAPNPPLQYPKPYCAADNTGLCSLYKVETKPPLPD